MHNFIWILVVVAAAAFVLAVIASLFGPVLGVWPEAFSRAANNIALIAIALTLLSDRRRV